MELQADIEQADLDQEQGGWELTSEKCPEVDCGGNLSTAFFANGPDDYTRKWKCDTCKEIFDE